MILNIENKHKNEHEIFILPLSHGHIQALKSSLRLLKIWMHLRFSLSDKSKPGPLIRNPGLSSREKLNPDVKRISKHIRVMM